MTFLLDTHLLLWVSIQPDDLPREAGRIMSDPDNALIFSVVSIWEVVIKLAKRPKSLEVDPRNLRRGLLDNGYRELGVSAEHVLAVAALPTLHNDPFDRLLIAQARVEAATLLTADAAVARYPGAIRKV